MRGINRRKFEALHRLLCRIDAKPANARLLAPFQLRLIEEITQVETQLNKCKRARSHLTSALKLGGNPRAISEKLRRRILIVDAKIESLSHLLFVWRCFGDAVAFIHLDKFALKQTFFETASVRPKQSAGWLSGKAGMAVELAKMREASRQKLPVLLTDLTNTIRHGDLCVLVGPDPLLLESKSSDRLNSRGKRQRASLEKLGAFYSADVATDLRGYSEIRRVHAHAIESTYVDELNSCIDLADQFDLAAIQPELGLHYVAVYRGHPQDMADAIESLVQDTTQIIYLNEFKSRGDWSPYFPFLLSIRRCKHAFDFVRGRLGLVVLFDNNQFDQRLAARGISRVPTEKTPADWGDDYVVLRKAATGAQAGVSRQFLLRIALEFTSPSWMAEYFDHLLQRQDAASAGETASPL